MNPLNHIDERWFLRSLLGLSLVASLALVAAHRSGFWLRPAERVEESAPGPAPTR